MDNKLLTAFPPILYLLQYLLSSFIIISDNKNTAIKFGTARKSVKASDRFTTLFRFIAEPMTMNMQYIIWNVLVVSFDSPNKNVQDFVP